MRLSGIARAAGGRLIGPDLDVRGLAEDSRLVSKGDLFFCVRGYRQDGEAFAAQAVRKGAAALFVEGRPLRGFRVPQVVVRDMRRSMARAAHAFHGDPSRSLRVVGVTGTKGKTTVTYLLRSILRAAGERTGLIGTISYETGRRVHDAPNTTPSPIVVARLLAEMRDAGCRWCVMEVSSHALAMHRVEGVRFAGAVFTNLGLDHLDYHRTFAAYFAAKCRLFTRFPTVRARAVNADDPWGRRLLRTLGRRAVAYGIDHPAKYRATGIWVSPEGLRFRLGRREMAAPMTGVFNVYNALAALAVLRELGLPWNALKAGLARAQAVPGRFETVKEGQDFTVVVDYAHTPNALEEALKTGRELAGESRLISVFGCGGDRDRTKRPVMGALSARLADLTLLTSDNPRSEAPRAILREILRGVPPALLRNGSRRVFTEPDRRRAIRMALREARTGDLVLIAGKGHETYQVSKGRKTHFDDREEARAVLKRLGAKPRRTARSSRGTI
jgi:UDP-N-acetylmuramoyl-L-alanyl-D-glutamate--2,6-diaminopimelate ligase